VATLSAGSLIFSDSVEDIVPERLAILKAMLPPLPAEAQFVDLLSPGIPGMAAVELKPTAGASALGSWHLVGLFNWTDGLETLDTKLQLPICAPGIFEPPAQEDAEWHVFEFWSGTYSRHTASSGRLPVTGVPPRGCRLLSVRPVLQGRPQLIGSDVHVSCGLEVKSWSETMLDGRSIEIALDVGRAVRAPRVWLSLPGSSPQQPPKLSVGGSGEAAQSLFVMGDVWQVTLPPATADGGTPICRIEW